MDNINPKEVAKYEGEIAQLQAELEVLDKNLSLANEELEKSQSIYDASAQSVKQLEGEIKKASGSSLKKLKE
jgi:Tfp pilus assembly protein FimV